MKLSTLFFNIIIGIALLSMIHGCAAVSENETVISGEVTDASSGDVIEGVVVEITSPEEHAENYILTNEQGIFSFSIEVEEPTDITIQASHPELGNANKNIRVLPGSDMDGIRIVLGSSSNTGGGGNSGNNDDELGGQAGPPNSLELVGISSSSIAINGTGGDETSKFTFAVTDSAGRPVEQGHEINFSIIRGPEGGEYIDPPIGITNSEGRVSSVIASGDSAGVVKIRASVNAEIQSTPVLVAIGNGFPESSNFRIAPVWVNFEAWNLIASSQSTVQPNYIVATLGDYRNNPVLPGTAVDFTTTAGIIQANAVTDEEGLAIVEIRPDGSTPTNHPLGIGFATVTASTVDIYDNYITDETTLLFTSRDPRIQLFDPGTTIPATVNIPSNGSQSFDLVIEDINGYPVAAGSEISVVSSNGTENNFGTKTLGDFITPGPGRTEFGFTIADSDDMNPTEQSASVTITVTLPSGDSKFVKF